MRFLARLIAYMAALVLSGIALAGVAAAIMYFEYDKELPAVDELREVRLQVPLRIYTAEGLLMGEYGEQRREPVTYEQIPETVVQAFLAAEDDRFFEHPGVDYRGLIRAGVDLIRTGERRQGGSTITMQVARNFFLTPEKTYTRKIKEILLAMKIEREMSKEEILALYLNKIYLGQRAYGIAAAARVYYGKTLDELTLAETAMIAGLPKAPSKFNPIANPDRAILRRNYVLGRMEEVGFISEEVLERESSAEITAHAYRPDIQFRAEYVAEMARAWMVDRYGEEGAYTGGYHVYTTIESRLQRAGRAGVWAALDAYDKRHGYRGPEARVDNGVVPEDVGKIGHLLPAVVTEVGAKSASVILDDGTELDLDWEGLSWASRYKSANSRGASPNRAADVVARGDVVRVVEEHTDEGEKRWRLAQVPAVQGAMVSLDPHTGAIHALVGGYDYFHSKFNRAMQAKRQPGSGFKPFIYSAALDAGYTPATLVNDTPVVIEDPSLPEGYWKPANYGHKFFGPTALRQGLAKSRNLISIRVLRSIGIERTLDHLDNFGLDATRFTPGLSLALGVGEVTPWEMARAYGVFANGGYLVEPHLVERVEQEGEGEIYRDSSLMVCADCEMTAGAEPQIRETAPRTLSAENRFLMYSMMKDVVQAGTATAAKVLGRQDLAGKTGTTNEYRDAWFNGYNESHVAIFWVGRDDFKPLGRGEAGGKAALPGWIVYMREALKDVPETQPEPPSGIVVKQVGSGNEYFDSTVEADFIPDPVTPDSEDERPEFDLF